jgi:putative sigma-54 modulation protein
VQVSISARHGQLSETTREKVAAKFEKLTRIFERLTAISVTVDLQNKEVLVVEALVSAEHKHDFVAREEAEELMAAVDTAIHKLEQQLRKYKEKVQDHHR